MSELDAIYNPQEMFNRNAFAKKPTIPEDRTQKQPVSCFCRNPDCVEIPGGMFFVFQHEHSHVECPKCGATEAPMVGVFVITHYMAKLPKRGQIVGVGGLRYTVACDEKRNYLATATNMEAASDQIEAVTCPGCLEAIRTKKVDTSKAYSIKAKL